MTSTTPKNATGDGTDTIQLLSTEEAAERLRVSPRTVKRWRAEGIGPAYVRIGHRTRYTPSSLEEFVRQHTRGVA